MSEIVLAVHFSAGADGRPTADGNVAVLVDGMPEFAVAQERVTREKYDGGFLESARYALDNSGISISDVKAVAVSTFGRPDAPDNPQTSGSRVVVGV
jgi:carbamoyltransferase